MQETDPSPKVGIIDLLERWKEFAACLILYPTAEAYTFVDASGGPYAGSAKGRRPLDPL